jgi:hypothetical protein
MKNLTRFVLALALVAFSLTASAQFHPSGAYVKDLAGAANVITIAPSTITNLTTAVYVGKDGFSITPNFGASGASSSLLTVYVTPVPDGVNSVSNAPVIVNTLTANGTTAVRNSVYVASTTYPGTGFMRISLTNASATVSFYVTNCVVAAW